MLRYQRLFLILLNIAYSITSTAQRIPVNSDTDCARISFNNDTIDLGDMMHNSEIMRTITIINSGKCPLIITNVSGGDPHEFVCDRAFIQPGDSGQLKLYYKAADTGRIMQNINIFSNIGIHPKLLVIRGNILAEKRCAVMEFVSDTIDFGNIPYVIGKHFYVDVRNTGSCNLTFAVEPSRDQYLNILDYTHDSIKPGDTGKISIHTGGQFTGNFYGRITVISDNASPGIKTEYLKGRFVLQTATDSNESTIEVSQDFFDFKTVHYGNAAPARSMSGYLEITNTGKKTLVITQNDPFLMAFSSPVSPLRLLPGARSVMTIHFYYTGPFTAKGEVFVHTLISGNFRGRNMPIYAKWSYEK